MAQSVSLWGAAYSNVPALIVPKTGGGTAKFTDVSDTTAASSDVASGKVFYDANGARQTGSASGGGAGAFVDETETLPNGGIHHIITGVDISADTVTAEHLEQGFTAHDAFGNLVLGTLVAGGGGGLEYEEGTYAPTSDVISPTITFSNSHATAPFFFAYIDVTGTYSSTTSSLHAVYYIEQYGAYGVTMDQSSTSVIYGVVARVYRTTSTTSLTIGTTYLTQRPDATPSMSGQAMYPINWASNTRIRPNVTSDTAQTSRAGRTYKWIAVWK